MLSSKTTIPAILQVLIACTCFAQSAMRTWSAATGGFSVKAELLDVRDNKVQLNKEDGSTVWVPIDKLSLSDVRYVEETLRKAREKLNSADSPPSQKTTARDESSEMQPADLPAETTPLADSSEPDAETDDADKVPGWELGSATGGSPNPFAGMRDVNMVLGRATSSDLCFPPVPSAWFALRSHQGGSYAYQIANIRTGKRLDPFVVNGSPMQCTLSPDGSLLAVSGGHPSKLEIYSTSSGKRVKEYVLEGLLSVQSLIFYAPQTLLMHIQSGGSSLKQFDVKSGKLTKSIELGTMFFRKYAVSPNGRLMAVGSNNLVSLIDLKTGKKKTDLALVSSGNSYLSVDDLAFSLDGNELAVLCGGTGTELHVFSLKSGKSIARHSLTTRGHELHSGQYLGAPVEWLSGNKGWMLYGKAIVDRETGGPIWVADKQSGSHQNPFSALIDDNRQVVLIGDYSAARFEIQKLPWDDISTSKSVVEKGGTVEDTNLPPIQVVNAKDAKPLRSSGKPKLYEGQPVATADLPERIDISLPAGSGSVTRALFSTPSVGKMFVVPQAFMPNSKKEGFLVDLNKRRIADSIDLNFVSMVQDLSPQASFIATTTGKQGDRVDIFDTQSGKHVLGFRPYAEATSGLNRLSGAKFISEDLLITTGINSTAIAWQLPKLQPTYRFETIGTIHRFPTSEQFVHQSKEGWCVRRSRDGDLIGMLESPAQNAVALAKSLSIIDDESACAAIMSINDQDSLIVWDLQTGKIRKRVPLSTIASTYVLVLDSSRRVRFYDFTTRKQLENIPIRNAASISWCQRDLLLINWAAQDQGRFAQPNAVSSAVSSLYDLNSDRLLWDYRFALGRTAENGPSGKLWFIEFANGTSNISGIEAPTELAAKAIASAPPGKSVLPDGTQVTVEINVNISGDSLADGVLGDQVANLVESRLKEHGIQQSARGGLKLSVQVDQVVDSTNRQAKSKILSSCRLTDISGNIVWSHDNLIDAVEADPNQTVLKKDVQRRNWAMAMDWIASTIDPSKMYERWYYRGLGESLLSNSEEKLIQNLFSWELMALRVSNTRLIPRRIFGL